MNNLVSYIKCDSIVKQYAKEFLNVKNIVDDKYQHFVTRLNECPRFKEVTAAYWNKDMFSAGKKHLDQILELLRDKDYEKLIQDIKQGDPKGFCDEFIKVDREAAAFVFSMMKAVSYVSIFLRNHINISKQTLELFSEVFNNEAVTNLIKQTVENKNLQDLEGTACMNTLGYMLYVKKLRSELIDVPLEEIESAFVKVFAIYRDKCKEYYRKHILTLDLTDSQVHNIIYGLTHGVINCSDFYVKNPWDTKNSDIKSLLRSSYRILYTILRASKSVDYKNLNADALAEILLCLKMLDPEWKTTPTFTDTLYKLEGYFDYESHIMVNKNDDKSLASNEHTNILYIMVHNWDVPEIQK